MIHLDDLSKALHAQLKASKVENAKATIAARRALRRKTEAEKRARYAAVTKAGTEVPRKPPIPAFITAFGQTFPTASNPTWRDEGEFLQALTKLCDLYGVAISGCGCCGSPFLSTIEPGQTLIGYTNKSQLEPVFAPKPKKVRGDDLEGLGIGLSGMVEEMGPHGIGVRSSGRSY